MIKVLSTFICYLLSILLSHSQVEHAEILSKTDSIKAYYNSETYEVINYINGKEYKHYHLHNQSNPYFQEAQGSGNVYYNGNSFKNLNLIYDINLDELIAIPSEFAFQNTHIALNKTCIDSFDLKINHQTYKLIHLRNINSQFKSLSNGYYEIAHKGKHKLLIQYTCSIIKPEGHTVYEPIENKYILVNGEYYNINYKRKLLTLFPEDKKRIKKQYRRLQITYKNMTTPQLVELVKFTETL